jgi:hypothetical protein
VFALQTELGLAAWAVVVVVVIGLRAFVRCFGSMGVQ